MLRHHITLAVAVERPIVLMSRAPGEPRREEISAHLRGARAHLRAVVRLHPNAAELDSLTRSCLRAARELAEAERHLFLDEEKP